MKYKAVPIGLNWGVVNENETPWRGACATRSIARQIAKILNAKSSKKNGS